MKKLLLLGAALLGLCAISPTARAGGDDYRDYDDEDRPAPRHYESRVVERRCYPSTTTVYFAAPPLPLPPLPFVFGRGYHHRHYYRPHNYGYRHEYGYRPRVQIGFGF